MGESSVVLRVELPDTILTRPEWCPAPGCTTMHTGRQAFDSIYRVQVMLIVDWCTLMAFFLRAVVNPLDISSDRYGVEQGVLHCGKCYNRQ